MTCVDNLKTLLSSVYAFSIKTQQFHWNVESEDFAQYHEFFQELYEEVYSSIDTIAEHIRALKAYSPGSMERFMELSQIKGQLQIPSCPLMFKELMDNNDVLIAILKQSIESAKLEKHYGLENFLSERLDIHEKHAWMLRSFKF